MVSQVFGDVNNNKLVNGSVTALDMLFSPVEILLPFAVLRPLLDIVSTPINAVLDFAAVILNIA